MKNRKRNRMIGFDYSKDAIYFVTSCCLNRIHHFGEIVNREMQLNKFGEIAYNQILWLTEQYPYIHLHNFVVMPNHVHILFEIDSAYVTGTDRDLHPVRTGRDLSLRNPNPKIKSVSSIMGAYKTTTSKQIHDFGNTDFNWQRSFHDRIVRDAKRYDNIFNYISDNPLRWKEDVFNKQTNPNYCEDE